MAEFTLPRNSKIGTGKTFAGPLGSTRAMRSGKTAL